MEGEEIGHAEQLALLKDLLADFLAGGVDVTISVMFLVKPAADVESVSPEAAICAPLAEVREGEEIAADDPAD